MKAIQKNKTPQILEEIYEKIKKGEISIGSEPFRSLIDSDYRVFNEETGEETITPIKKIVQKALADEQGWICCYCNQKIEEDSDGHILMKIEHYKPDSLYTGQPITEKEKHKLAPENQDRDKLPDYRIAYSNFLCACKGEHCDNSGFGKGDWELVSIPNPSTIDERDFQRVYELFYSSSGRIYSRKRLESTLNDKSTDCSCACNNEAQKRSCLNWELGGCPKKDKGFEQGMLNLNEEKLVQSRQGAWNAVLRSIVNDVLHVNPLKIEQMNWRKELKDRQKVDEAKNAAKNKLALYKQRKKDGKFFPFCAYVQYRLVNDFDLH